MDNIYYEEIYLRVKSFIKNELRIELTFYQEQCLKYLIDDKVQEHLKELYK